MNQRALFLDTMPNVLVIGAGAIGSRVIPHLVALPDVGAIRVVDGDRVEERNLTRLAPYFVASDVGKAKVKVVQAQYAQVEGVDAFFSPEEADALLDSVELVLDLADDLHLTRLLDRLGRDKGLPVLVASVHRDQGMVYILYAHGQGPTFQDVFRGPIGDQQDQCDMDAVSVETLERMEQGVLNRLRAFMGQQEGGLKSDTVISVLDKGDWLHMDIASTV